MLRQETIQAVAAEMHRAANSRLPAVVDTSHEVYASNLVEISAGLTLRFPPLRVSPPEIDETLDQYVVRFAAAARAWTALVERAALDITRIVEEIP